MSKDKFHHEHLGDTLYCCSVAEDVTAKPVADTPLSYQVGGNHYNSMKIQPVEFIVANDIPYREANVIKYVVRYKNKNGLQDLLKARQYLDMLIHDLQTTKRISNL